MAHACSNCGNDCHCSGDIDDQIINETPLDCIGCECAADVPEVPELDICPGCGREMNDPDWDFEICPKCNAK